MVPAITMKLTKQSGNYSQITLSDLLLTKLGENPLHTASKCSDVE